MWLRLGSDEIVNLDLVTSLKRNGAKSIEIHYLDPQATRTIHFDNPEFCEMAFESLIQNLSNMGLAME